MCVWLSEAQGLEMICISLGDGGTTWALDATGSLWFRTGIRSSKPQGDDNHWWQVDSSNVLVYLRQVDLSVVSSCFGFSPSD